MIKKLSILSILAITTMGMLLSPLKAHAVTAADWQAGSIIDDGIFTNKDSMSVADIQNFLNQKVGTTQANGTPGVCDTNGVKVSELGGGTRAQYGAAHGNPTPFTCLKDYYEVPKTSPGPSIPASNYGGVAIPSGAISAAQIIYNAAQQYDINPEVLLTVLQKESAGPLVTDDWPFKSQYLYAMGAHCPDSNGCDPNYAGFSIQMSESAALFRWYLDNMTQPWWTYKKLGNNTILYSPNTSCGSSTVNITTSATAALYTYTPYQPNQAALNNLYGSGDSCSAYGNRNFWRIFSDWFGSTHGDLVGVQNGGVYKLEDGTKRAFPDEITFLSYSLSWNNISLIGASQLSQIPDGTAMPYNVHFRDGHLVTSSGGGMYVVDNGTKRPFPNEATFFSYGYKFTDALAISSAELNMIPDGTAMPYNVHFRDGHLVTSSGGGMYVVDNGTKRPFPNEATFFSYGYKFTDALAISSAELNMIPDGTAMPPKV